VRGGAVSSLHIFPKRTRFHTVRLKPTTTPRKNSNVTVFILLVRFVLKQNVLVWAYLRFPTWVLPNKKGTGYLSGSVKNTF